MTSATQLTVFIASGEVICEECGADLGHHAWHMETAYDTLLGQGVSRREARAAVAGQVEQIVAAWAG